jgi:2-polyprenyl-3-methyl-5-hydroxy-6-metoxy-1,4-benzoquinol methylase
MPDPTPAAPNPQLESVACPVCGGTQTTPQGQAMDLAGTEAFALVRCSACGLLYTNPRPTSAALGHYYSHQYYALRGVGSAGAVRVRSPRRQRLWRAAMTHGLGYPPDPTADSALARLLAGPIAWRLRHNWRRMAIPWHGQGRLLDFGCGNGRFLVLQRSRGWQVCGLDFSPEVVGQARAELGLDAQVGTWPGSAMADRTFDFITAWHVLEHLPDPSGWTAQALRQLTPGGYLQVCTPNSDSWSRRVFGNDWRGWEVPVHFNHFTAAQLARLLQDQGFTVVSIRPQTLAWMWAQSAQTRARRTGQWWWRFLARRKLPWRLAEWLAGCCGAGSGAIVLARKPAGPPPHA